MAETQLRAVVAGLGVMGSLHLRVLAGIEGVAVVGVVDPDLERRERAAASATGAAPYASLDEALERESPDFACIAAPASELAGLALRAIAAGLPALVEKPLAATEAEALEVMRAAKDAGVLISVGHVERFNPAVVALKTKLADGAAGRIYQLHARRLSPYPDRPTPVSVSRDLATHDVDVMRFVLGTEVRRVFAEAARRNQSDIDDLVCGTLRFDDDTTGLLEVNWLTPTKVRELTVTGERGMFVVDYLTQDLAFYENPRARVEWDTLGVLRGSGEGDMVRFALQRREPLLAQWEAFVDALRSSGPAPVPIADGLAALSIARALEQSGASAQPVVPSYRESIAPLPM